MQVLLEKTAVLVDLGFFENEFRRENQRPPTPEETLRFPRWALDGILHDTNLFRIYFYDGSPLDKEITNPISGAKTTVMDAESRRKYHDAIAGSQKSLLRLGRLAYYKRWFIKEKVQDRIIRGQATLPLAPDDIQPATQQKAVDMLIGMDIVALAIKQTVKNVMILTGDTDLVPAMTFARNEGCAVGLIATTKGISTGPLASDCDHVTVCSARLPWTYEGQVEHQRESGT